MPDTYRDPYSQAQIFVPTKWEKLEAQRQKDIDKTQKELKEELEEVRKLKEELKKQLNTP